MRIAVISTSFNRREKTIKAFSSLSVYNKNELEFFLCDDRSTDGTADALKKIFPSIHIIYGSGDLFWSRGMNKAMSEAKKGDFDFYLMINDDVEFFTDAIDTMLDTYMKAEKSCGVVGATLNQGEKETSYGGKMINGKNFILPNGELQCCDLANWNCFLIDRNIINRIGVIDPYYEHAHGDYDYSLMMRRAGFDIFVSLKYIGVCNRNSKHNTYMDSKLPRMKRLKLLTSRVGMPIKSGLYYCKKNYKSLGILGFKSFIGTYTKNIVKIILGKEC